MYPSQIGPNHPVMKAMHVNLRNILEKLPPPFNEGYEDIIGNLAAVAYKTAGNVAAASAPFEERIPKDSNGEPEIKFLHDLIATSLRVAADQIEQGTAEYLRFYPQERKTDADGSQGPQGGSGDVRGGEGGAGQE